MSKKDSVSHNACYDYSRCRWNLQPADMVRFWDRDSSFVGVGEVVSVSLELVHVRRLKDNRIFVISTFDMRDWQLRRVDYVQRLPNGIFSVGERVDLDGNFGMDEFTIEKFKDNRVFIRCSVKGRVVGHFWVLLGEVLKFKE